MSSTAIVRKTSTLLSVLLLAWTGTVSATDSEPAPRSGLCPESERIIEADSFIVEAGQSVVLLESTAILANRIEILGSLLGVASAEAGRAGVSICIQASELVLSGLLCGGDGYDQTPASGPVTSGTYVGGPGSPGGSVVLDVPLAGLDVMPGAEICSGAGGDGQDLFGFDDSFQSPGFCSSVPSAPVTVIGGAGASSGDLAASGASLEGLADRGVTLRLGDGGDGGDGSVLYGSLEGGHAFGGAAGDSGNLAYPFEAIAASTGGDGGSAVTIPCPQAVGASQAKTASLCEEAIDCKAGLELNACQALASLLSQDNHASAVGCDPNVKDYKPCEKATGDCAPDPCPDETCEVEECDEETEDCAPGLPCRGWDCLVECEIGSEDCIPDGPCDEWFTQILCHVVDGCVETPQWCIDGMPGTSEVGGCSESGSASATAENGGTGVIRGGEGGSATAIACPGIPGVPGEPGRGGNTLWIDEQPTDGKPGSPGTKGGSAFASAGNGGAAVLQGGDGGAAWAEAGNGGDGGAGGNGGAGAHIVHKPAECQSGADGGDGGSGGDGGDATVKYGRGGQANPVFGTDGTNGAAVAKAGAGGASVPGKGGQHSQTWWEVIRSRVVVGTCADDSEVHHGTDGNSYPGEPGSQNVW